MMPDRNIVIKGLEPILCCAKQEKWGAWIDTLEDAIALLKREAEPELEGGGHTWWFVCSECHGAIDEKDQYCKHCGARMKKEGRGRR